MDISFPPEPVTDTQRAQFTPLLDRAARWINDALREPSTAPTAAELAPLIAKIERFFAKHEPPIDVRRLLAWYHSQ